MNVHRNAVTKSSLNKKVNPYKACIYVLCRDFFVGVGYDLGTKFYCRNGEPFTLTMMIYLCYFPFCVFQYLTL